MNETEVFNIQESTEEAALETAKQQLGESNDFEVVGYTPAPAEHGGSFFTVERTLSQ